MAADMSMMLLIHAAFRRDFAYLADRVAACPPSDIGTATELGHAFEFVAGQLHHHHSGEDADLWPMAKAKLGGDAAGLAVLEAMQAQHRRIDPALEAVRAGFADLQAGTAAPAEVANCIRSLAAAVMAHLDAEERDAVPLLARVLDEDDLKAFSRMQMKRGGGMKAGAVFFPWLVDGLSEGDRRRALSAFPPPVRFLTQRVWPRAYRKAAPALQR